MMSHVEVRGRTPMLPTSSPVYQVALVQVARHGNHHRHTQEQESKYPTELKKYRDSKFWGQRSEVGGHTLYTYTLTTHTGHNIRWRC